MLHEQLSKNLKEGETLIRVIRRDFLAGFGPVGLAVFLVLLDFFLLAWFVRHGPWGIAGFMVLLITALLIGIRSLVEWRLNALLLTSERIIHVFQKGFFTRTVSETTFDQVTDVRFSVKGPLQTAFDLGAVEVQTAGEGENLRLAGVRHPPQVQAFITDLLRRSRQVQTGPLSAQELVAALTRVKHELGRDAFHTLLSKVSDKGGGKKADLDGRR